LPGSVVPERAGRARRLTGPAPGRRDPGMYGRDRRRKPPRSRRRHVPHRTL